MSDAGVERARRARLRRLRTDSLALEHEDHRLSDAVEDAKTAILQLADDGPHADQVAALLAALVIGDHDATRTGIGALHDDAKRLKPGAFLRAALVARYYAWTGDALSLRPWLRPAIITLEGSTDDAARVVARDLIAVAEALGEAEAGTRLRARAQGADPNRSADVAFTHADGGATARAAEALHALLSGRTDAGIRAWSELALEPGTADERAWLLPVLAAGILGIDPDAERGRVRTRLHVPSTWHAWAATSIRVGDARLDMRIRRDATHIEITADQTAGPLPLTLILEPSVHAPITAARVDGIPADLALRAYADRIVAPVQLVLDCPRTLALDLKPAD